MKIFSDYTSLTLNGTFLKGEEIAAFCKEQNKEIFTQIAAFINVWLQPDPYISIKTSGSTGIPKTISVEKNKMLFSASHTAQYFGFEASQKSLLCLPVTYIAGKMMIVRAFFSGLNLICVNPSQNPLETLQPGITIDFAAMIPLQLQQAINTPSLSQIRRILLGGGPVSHDLENQTQHLTTEIFHGYGMTETLSHIALRRVNGDKASQTYKALNGIELSMDSRKCLTITAIGLADETLVTNDIVSFTGINEFIWKGRYDNVINSGGIKLIPEEIEGKLHSLLSRRFYLTGIKDEKWGEKLILIIEGASLDEDNMISIKMQMETLLNKYEIPKQIYFVNEFVETKNGKINRPKTTALAVAG
ncbi:MAG: AMP-binding protein [Ginsengibacter sp.]